jgi:AcrR family transcriptional regulator
LLDVTEQIMVEEGYAAVSSRHVAAGAGINAPLVHYYFPTLDDLFIAVYRRGADKNLVRLATALASRRPLEALWKFSIDPRGTSLLNELIAAANHRKALREVIVETSESARRMQIAALRELLTGYGIDTTAFPPELVAAAMQGLARLIVREQGLGLATDNDVVFEAVGKLLDGLEVRRNLTT